MPHHLTSYCYEKVKYYDVNNVMTIYTLKLSL